MGVFRILVASLQSYEIKRILKLNFYNMKKALLLLLTLPFLLSGCKKDNTPDPDPETHTLIMYMIGTNEKISYNLKGNISDVCASVNKTFPEGSKIFIYYHGYDERLGTPECALYEVVPPTESGVASTLRMHEEYDFERASTSGAVIKSLIDKVKGLSKTDTYGMAFLGHSTGWFPAEFSLNEPQRSQGGAPVMKHDFSRPEESMTRAFGPTPRDAWGNVSDIVAGVSGANLEYLMFDMCFMSSAEVLYDLRGSAKYILGTPAEILINGFPYRRVIVPLFSKKTDYSFAERLSDISEAIVEYYGSGGAGHEDKDYWAASITVVETAKIDAFAQSVKDIFAAKDKTFDESRVNDITYIQYLELIPDHAFFDLKDYLGKICSDQTLLSKFDTSLADMIVKEYHTPYTYSGYGETGRVQLNRFCGLSTYIPRDKYPVMKAAYNNTAWAKFVLPAAQ